MANTINLNVSDSSQVQFPQKVAVLTAESNIWLLIYSGVAVQRLRAQGSTGFLGFGKSTSETDAVVHVTIDRISGVLLQAATSASMANILEEETWGQWIISSTGLSIRDNGDLVLTVNTSVTGIDDVEFWSFYYNVSAKVVLDKASISGTIRLAQEPSHTARFDAFFNQRRHQGEDRHPRPVPIRQSHRRGCWPRRRR